MAHCRRNVAEYFVVVGLNESSQRCDANGEIQESVGDGPEQMDLPVLAEPITDISVVFAGSGERLPSDYQCITQTPGKHSACLNHGSSNASKAVYICYKRGRDNAPLTDIDIAYRSPQLVDYQVITSSVMSHKSADINHSPASAATYMAYRRAPLTGVGSGYHFYGMALTDLCLINGSKNEPVPRGFTMINKAIHGGLTGPTFYLCYKKSLIKPHAVSYRATILHRFPLVDSEDFPLPESVPLFCLPLGASVESWSDSVAHPLPTFSSFVLTGAIGEKVYGAAVVFYDELPLSKQTLAMRRVLFGTEAETSTQRLFCNKAICILSRWPFFQAFKTYLSSLYRISISGPSPIPLERYISNFMIDVPFPSSSRPRVLIQLGPESVLLSQPVKTALPLSGATHSILLRCLDANNLMTLLALVLLEYQIILHSVRPSLLTSFGEALCSILFPFSWQCPYIPLCPLALASFIHAPMPFLVGIDSRYFDLYDTPEDCVCINLDNNTIAHSGSSRSVSGQVLPKKPAQQLSRTLKQLQTQVPLSTDLDSDLAVAVVPPPSDTQAPAKSDSASLNLSIREAFLRFHAQLLGGYSAFLRPLTRAPSQASTDISQLFDLRGFLKSRPSQEHSFFTKFFQTQIFSNLIEQRSFTSSGDSGTLAFFDECVINADKPEPLVKLSVNDKSSSSMTVVATPPDLSGLEDKDYTYDTFTLDERLFSAPKPPTANVRTVAESSPPASVTTDSPAQSVFQRTTAEREKSLQMAVQDSESPQAWANYLYSQVFALWFIHLPAFAHCHPFKREALSLAFRVFEKMDEQRVRLPDEVSYRVLMDLCAKLGHPMLAVRVLMEMRRVSITPNAVTYAHYNKAVLECDWPSKAHLWRTLRNVLNVIVRLKRLLKEKRDGQAALNALASADAASIEIARKKSKVPDLGVRRSSSCFTPDTQLQLNMSSSVGCDTSHSPVRRHRRQSSLSLSHEAGVSEGTITLLAPNSQNVGAGGGEWPSSFSATPSMENVSGCSSTMESSEEQTSAHSGRSVFGSPKTHANLDLSSSSLGGSRTANSSPTKMRKNSTAHLHSTFSALASGLRHVGSARNSLTIASHVPRMAHVEPGTEITAGIRMSSSVRCHQCHCVLYDEQIMSRWKADDSNLNTSCCYCGKSLVSFLIIQPECYDQRLSLPNIPSDPTSSPPGLSIDSFAAGPTQHVSVEKQSLPQLSVPFLSPLLLRKEFETLLANDGVDVMLTSSFVDQHPVIYWNLLYFFVRLNLPIKLASLYAGSMQAQSCNVRPGSVSVHLVWHIPIESDVSLPFYQRWLSRGMQQNVIQSLERDELSSQLQSLAARLQCGDYNAPMAAMLKERLTARRGSSSTGTGTAGKSDPTVFRSVYWELLCFLAVVRGASLDLGKFDREYSRAVGRLSKDMSVELRQDDHGPDAHALAFRSRFGAISM
eukprot:scpid16412/ scgid3295/ C-myc promoter-binding protein; DENN domain-containing protein 4A